MFWALIEALALHDVGGIVILLAVVALWWVDPCADIHGFPGAQRGIWSRHLRAIHGLHTLGGQFLLEVQQLILLAGEVEVVLLYEHHLVGANRLVVLALARQGHVDLFHLRVLIPCPHGPQGVV